MVCKSLIIALIAFAPVALPRSQDSPPPIRFHHLHLNSTNPDAAIDFYTRTFDVTRRVSHAGFDGVQSENIFLLFNKVAAPPPVSPASAIWHFGWGSTAMETDYEKHRSRGIEFATPMTRLGSGLLFAYMRGPDGALIEINTAQTRAFLHVHLYSDAPLCAADWYVKHLGATRRGATRSGSCEVPFAAPSEPLGVIRSPAATVRFGEISLIIYPRQRPEPLANPRGHVVDHIALAVSDLKSTLDRLRSSGVKMLSGLEAFGTSGRQSAMIEGPDAIAIELVEQQQ